MNSFPDYNRATNAAYEILREYHGRYPQIDVYELLVSNKNVKVHTYSEMAKRMEMTFSEYLAFCGSDDGFTAFNKISGKWIVFYNDMKSERTVRFTLAHELGHIVLRHDDDDDPISQREANCFARNILCPAPLRDGFNLKTVSDYCECFNVSEFMAEATLGHNSSDFYYISKDNYNAINDNAYFYLAGYTPADLYGY